MAKNQKRDRRLRIRRGIRSKVSGTAARPRLCVYRSNKHIYAQLIDDVAGHTLAAASTAESDLQSGSRIDQGTAVGKVLAERAREAGLETAVSNGILELAVGFSHPIYFLPPEGITITAETSRGKNPTVVVEGTDKQMVGQVAAKIRALRPPEPYKGKGIRYIDEYVRRKAGKTAAR